MHGSVVHGETPDIYRSHAVYVNLTPSGSFDKTIGEAMASGCISVVANEAVRGVIPDGYIVPPNSAEPVHRALRAAMALSEAARTEIAEQSRAYIVREHSLALLTEKLHGIFTV
jgi:glycosyltransferase involved in cell wall biosynthesis